MLPSKIIDRFPDLTLLVVGDFLLDEFVLGEISRVSREAPVLILKYNDSDFRPGGAANTAANAADLGARVIALGYVGRDKWSEHLIDCWPAGVDSERLYRSPQLQTTRKSRILAGSFQSFRQQVVRLDFEKETVLSLTQENRLCRDLRTIIPQVDAVILSDYSLGNLTARVRQTAISTASAHGKPITVDSRDDPSGFPGATMVTPNISELEAIVGADFGESSEAIEGFGHRLLANWGVDSLLVTRGKMGMTLIEKGRVVHIPVFGSDEVADVTGAGDTVVATLACCLATGATSEQSARLANCAGGIVVMKKGTATVSAEELRRAAAGLA